MIDGYGRTIDYLRISITDRCNLRCKYCMPNGVECVAMSEILTYEEIVKVVEAASALGITKLKITGGEPFARRECVSLIRTLKQIPGIEQVTITTNGVLLKEQLNNLVEAGIDGINISLDTMNVDKFCQITGQDQFKEVIEAIQAAADIGAKNGIKIKINAVSLDFDGTAIESIKAGKLTDDMKALIHLAKDAPIDVRFIEMMPIGSGKGFPSVPHDLLRKALENEFKGLRKDTMVHGNGPAEYFTIDGYQGSVGLISAIHGKFCDKCNRIRLTSKGEMKSCLCYEEGAMLLPILRSNLDENEKRAQLEMAIREAIEKKPKQHCFEEPENMTESKKMSLIGG